MFEAGVVAQFEAAHQLRGEFGPAARLHGHTYRVEAAVRGTSLRPDGTLMDISVLQAAVDGAVSDLNYQDLDSVDVFGGQNTTAEAVAHHLFGAVEPHLRGQAVERLSVRVWESPVAFAGYEGPVKSQTGSGG